MFSLPNRPVSNGLNMTATAAAATTNSLVNVKQLTTRPSLVERIKDNVRYNYNHYSASIKDNINQPTQPLPPSPLKWSSSSSSLSSTGGGVGAAGDRRSVFYTDPDLAATITTTTANNTTAEKVSHVFFSRALYAQLKKSTAFVQQLANK